MSAVARVISLLMLFLTLGACAVNPVTGRTELMLVSEAQEIEIGREAAPSMKWSFDGAYDDPELQAYLEGIMVTLWANSERPQIPLNFYIQNTSMPNAFALPGHVAITRGLLAELENEAQFVAIMGHEMGHVMARHTAQRITQSQLLQLGLVAGGAAISGSGGDLFTQAGAIGGTLLLLKFSRDQELQADRLSVRYMSELGYDPYEALRAHERLEVAVDKYVERTGEERKGSILGSLLSTHPRHEVRREEIIAMIKDLPSYTISGDGKRSDKFLRMTEMLRKVNEDYIPYDRALKRYRDDDLAGAEKSLGEAISRNPEQAPFYNLLGLIRLRQDSFAEAERQFEMALAFDPGFQPSIFGRGASRYLQGNYRLALADFENSLRLYPDHLGTNLGLGASYFHLERFRDAIPYLEKVAEAVPKHPEVHGMLGVCYEAVGDFRSAYNEYVAQVQVAPNNEFGRHAQQRLLVLRPMLQLP